jgi:hypothetical protein
MKLTAEQEKELKNFPPALRALVERELEAGNSIKEIGHSFPAPPAGAYFKMAKKVTTRPRVSGSGLDFYDRNSSIYSGEFTDAKRFYFVIEPPSPPEPEADMDAIRKDFADRVAKSDAARRVAQEADRSSRMMAATKSKGSKARRKPRPATEKSEEGPRLPAHSVLQSSTKTGAKWLLHFQDSRPPQEIQFKLEQRLMALMPPEMEEGKLVCRGKVKMTGAPYSLVLTYEAALPKTNCYSLRVEASWADSSEKYYEYHQKTSGGWFEFWTRDFMRSSPPAPDAGSPKRYQDVCEAALKAEKHLDSVEAIQEAIIAAMKRGFGFSTSHKEGGTRIYWENGRFVRSDYGECNDLTEYKSEAEFLKFLWQFYEWQTRSNAYPDRYPDFEVWKLILRLQNAR